MRKRTEGTEDDEGESVADDPLSNGSDDHEDAAEEEVCSWTGDEVRLGLGGVCMLVREDVPVSEAPFPPAPLQPMRSHDKGVRLRRKPTRALSIASAASCTLDGTDTVVKLTWV